LRLKKNYLASGTSFKELLVGQSKRVKLKAKRKIEVLGYQMGVSCQRLSETEYLIVGTREIEPQAFAEYEKRWGVETLFGCLKSRGFDFEETHLTKRVRIERLTFLLSLALSLAIKTGEIKISGKTIKKKNNGRRIKSLFRIGLDYLQNLLVNLHLQS
jgi:transposase